MTNDTMSLDIRPWGG